MVKRFDYHDEDRFAFGLPIYIGQKRNRDGWGIRPRLLAAAGGAAATAGSLAYNVLPSSKDVRRYAVRRAADAYSWYKDTIDPDWVIRDNPLPMENYNRFERRVSKVYNDPGWVDDPGLVDEREYRSLYGNKFSGSGSAAASGSSLVLPKVPALPTLKYGTRFAKPGSVVKAKPLRAELDHPVKVELPDGEPSYIRPYTYSHDADDLVDQPVTDVKLGSSSVLNHSLYNVSMLGDRTICNDDGEGAAMVRANNGRFYWQVGALRYPVQYSGKSVVPFSVSNARYQFVVPLVDVS